MGRDLALSADADKGVWRRMANVILGWLPDAYEKVPKAAELEKAQQDALGDIVRTHAEGSVLLGAGRYVIDGDLLEEDDEDPVPPR